MQDHESYAAIDLGATSGRVMLGHYDGARIRMEEIHRFPNAPVQREHGLYWDWPHIASEIQQGLEIAARTGAPIRGVACNSWGHDHGFISPSGALLEWPYAYQDQRTTVIAAQVAAQQWSPMRLQQRTAGFSVPFSALHQVLATALERPELLHEAKRLLFMPGLANNILCGAEATEPCMASLTQLYDGGSGWDQELMECFNLPAHLFPPIRPCGELLGLYRPPVTGSPPWEVRLAAEHDTASALTAIPLSSMGDMAVSAGTWLMYGAETGAPCVTEKTVQAGAGSIRIPGGRWAVMNGMMGLYFLERYIREEGAPPAAELAERARLEPSSPTRFTPSALAIGPDETFRQALARTFAIQGAAMPESHAAMARCIYESLAEATAQAVHAMADMLDRKLERVFLVGGGAKCALFVELLAGFAQVPVFTGLTEATAMGNVLVQIWGGGQLSSLEAVRRVVSDSIIWRVSEPGKQ